MAFRISRRSMKEISKKYPYIENLNSVRKYGASVLNYIDPVTGEFTRQKYILLRTNTKGEAYPRDALWQKEGNKTLSWKFIGIFAQ